MLDIRKMALDYMNEVHLMSLSTCSNEKPWTTTVFFAFDEDLNLFFISNSFRRHSKEIETNPNVSGSIVKPHDSVENPKIGIQFEGIARVANREEAQNAFDIFMGRFPKAEVHIPSVDEMFTNEKISKIYKIIPSKIIWFDEKNFPDNPIQELKL